jgi:ATP-dependent helicase Lhr and Lhr-like helicase
VRPAAQAMHVLAHQVMALVLQEGGISRHLLLPWVHAAYPFSGVRDERFQALVDTMVERGILYEADAVLSLGAKGELLYGRKNFFDLYAVFTAPPVMRVLHGKSDVGQVQALFVSMHDRNEGPLCFRLSGRAWEVVEVEWGKGVLRVRPTSGGRVPTWLGQPGVLPEAICQAMMDVLVREHDEAHWLTRSAALELQSLREGYADLLEVGQAPLEDTPDGVQWHTFAGGAVNRLLAAGLKKASGKQWVSGNLSVRCKDIGFIAAREAVRQLTKIDWEKTAAQAAHSMVRGLISKFQPCLPEDAEDRLLAERLLDLPATLRFLATVKVAGHQAMDRPQGVRLVDGDDRMRATLELPTPTVTAALTPRCPIHWIDTSEALRRLCGELQGSEVLGLGVATALDFGTLCLLQIATREHTYLVDPFAVADLSPLAPVFAGVQPIKVTHNARIKQRVLAAVGLALDGTFDTMEESKRLRGEEMIGGHSLAAVCERELDISIDRSPQTSNWSHRPLDSDQLRYAAWDAEVQLQLYERFAAFRKTP